MRRARRDAEAPQPEPKSEPMIFLSYRRADSRIATYKLYHWLRERLPPEAVYLDMVSAVPGEDWEANVQRVIPRCRAVIVLIGDHWAGEHFWNSRHPVRIELDCAHAANVYILPILLNGVDMPTPTELFRELHWLRAFTAISLAIDTSQPDAELAPSTALDQLATALRTRAGVSLEHTPLYSQRAHAALRRHLLTGAQRTLERAARDLLHGASFIDLQLLPQPHVVAPSIELMAPADPRMRDPLVSAASLLGELASTRSLVLLGPAGSGKTALLYHIYQSLLEAANHDVTGEAPCPLYLSLATWALDTPRLPLANWIALRLRILLGFSHSEAREVVKHIPLALLLDGLDELPATDQAPCLREIERYIRAHAHQSLIVLTCRKDAERSDDADDAYARLADAQLNVSTALEAQPLDDTLINAHLAQADGDLEGLRNILGANADLHTLARTPLWLWLMIEVFRESATDDFLGTVAAADPFTDAAERFTQLRQRLLKRYVETRLAPELRGGRRRTTDDPSGAHQRRHRIRRATDIANAPDLHGVKERVVTAYPEQAALGWLIGLATLLKRSEKTAKPSSTITLYLEAIQMEMASPTLLVRVCAGLVFAMMGGVGVGLLAPFIFGQPLGLALALSTAFAVGMMGAKGAIDVHDRFNFTWRDYWAGLDATRKWRGRLLLALPVGGAALGLAYGLYESFQRAAGSGLGLSHPIWMLLGAAIGALAGLLYLGAMTIGGGFAAGFGAARTFTAKDTPPSYPTPNYGIRRTGQRGLIFAVAGCLIFGPLVGLNESLHASNGVAALAGARAGLGAALTAAVLFGVCDWLKHWIVRYALARQGLAPYRYVRFLRYATDRALLRQVGAGFEFRHSDLRDYFATLAPASPTPPELS